MGSGKGEEVCGEGGEEGGILLKQNMPTGHAVDCYLWFDFLLFYSIKLQICVSLKGNACTENKVVI